jgi:hypothetical protein
MGFYFRESISAGPFRFNFSKGGVGVSVGVKGLRIGTGPRGHYIRAGAGRLYYRGTIGAAGGRFERRPAPVREPRFDDSPMDNQSDVTMTQIESEDVLGMRDETFAAVLDELSQKQGQTKLSTTLGLVGGAIGLLGGMVLSGGAGAGLIGIAASLPGLIVGRWFDGYRRVTVLFYDLERDAEQAYGQLTDAFGTLTACGGKWHVASSGQIETLTAWKRNAGASALVQKKSTTFAHALPAVIQSNVLPPSIHVGRQVLYFMPDVVLVEDGSRFGAVSYGDLRLMSEPTNFIEDARRDGLLPVPRRRYGRPSSEPRHGRPRGSRVLRRGAGGHGRTRPRNAVRSGIRALERHPCDHAGRERARR